MAKTLIEVRVGDIYESKIARGSIRHEVIAVEPNRIRLKALGDGYKFWLDRETVEKYWVTKKQC